MPINILIVDDEKDIREITQHFLQKRGYGAFIAANAAEAVELVKSEHPQLILLDLRLGPESGIDILRQIKSIDSNNKVIMVTGLQDEESFRQAKELGADEFITKPFTADYLHQLIVKTLQ